MQIELKNLHSEVSDDFLFFDADLWIEGKEAGYVTFKTGAAITIRGANSLGEDLIRSANEYCKTLSPLNAEGTRGRKGEVAMDLEKYILKTVVSEHFQRELAQSKKQEPKQQKKKRRTR